MPTSNRRALTLANNALAATLLAVVYWSGFALIDPPDVSEVTRAVFFACCAAALLFVRRSARLHAPAMVWTIRAAYCALLAILFYGANQARDLLCGPERLKAALPGWFGGLELWWILCPGIASVCLAAAAARSRSVAVLALTPGGGRPCIRSASRDP
jgi:hypothetical protein